MRLHIDPQDQSSNPFELSNNSAHEITLDSKEKLKQVVASEKIVNHICICTRASESDEAQRETPYSFDSPMFGSPFSVFK